MEAAGAQKDRRGTPRMVTEFRIISFSYPVDDEEDEEDDEDEDKEDEEEEEDGAVGRLLRRCWLRRMPRCTAR
jgi:hypothetical protein